MHFIGQINSNTGGSYCLTGTWSQEGHISPPITVDRELGSEPPVIWNIGGHCVIVSSIVISKGGAISREFNAIPVFFRDKKKLVSDRFFIVPKKAISVSQLIGKYRYSERVLEIEDVSSINPNYDITESFSILEAGLSGPIFYSSDAMLDLMTYGPLERDFVATVR